MLINDVKNREEIHTLVTSELRLLGIKYRKDKKHKNGQVKKKTNITSKKKKIVLFLNFVQIILG